MDILAHAVAQHIEDMRLHVGAGTALRQTVWLFALIEAHRTSLHLPGMAMRRALCGPLPPKTQLLSSLPRLHGREPRRGMALAASDQSRQEPLQWY